MINVSDPPVNFPNPNINANPNQTKTLSPVISFCCVVPRNNDLIILIGHILHVAVVDCSLFSIVV